MAPALAWRRLFGGSLSQKRIDKVAKLASNPYAQPDVRMKELGRLLEDGSPEALRGALRRFASNASGAIADEDEKKFLEDAIVERGEEAVAPLCDYVRGEKQLTYALRAYRRIRGDADALAFFCDVLGGYGPDDYRSTDIKVQLLAAIDELGGSGKVWDILTLFLRDHSDEVSWMVMAMIERRVANGDFPPERHPEVADALADALGGGGVRILRRAAQLLEKFEWSLPASHAQLPADLLDEYFLDKKRFLRRRVGAGGGQ
jgi:hypothetical protein